MTSLTRSHHRRCIYVTFSLKMLFLHMLDPSDSEKEGICTIFKCTRMNH
jgi:hypothetical protein